MTDIASTSPASLLPSARRRWAALVVLVAGVLLLAIAGTVLKVRDEDGAVLFDFNHPLAGLPVTFEVKLIGVL